MYRKPNDNLVLKSEESKLKTTNQIGKKFAPIFDKLLDTGYYVGTKYANYFNHLNEDGTSPLYVHDPLETELKQFADSDLNEMKYMVGLTGMGKTTLLRNFFKIVDRDVKIEKDKIIIYISFFNANLSADNPQTSIEIEIVSYLSRAVKVLLQKNKKMIEDQEKFWMDFYNYIQKNKPTLLENENLTPKSNFIAGLFDISPDRKKDQLDIICSTKPIEYYCIFIKYILMLLENVYHIILIYDDIEAKKELFHDPLVEVSRHVHACLSAIEGEKSRVKSLVSMRAYTYRANIARQLEARREYFLNSTILKKNTVSLHDIFTYRFREMERIENTRNKAKSKDSYDKAKKVLDYVERQMDSIGNDLIYNISNYNLCDAMILYGKLLTNVKWIAVAEKEVRGSFKLDENSYRLTTENILYAIANDNSDGYMEMKNGCIPNILYNEFEGTDLVGLYIVRYMQLKGCTQVYGENYVEGREILSDLMGLFVNNNDSEARVDSWRYRILCLLEHLYKSGVLFRSFFDIEVADETQTERIYSNTYKLYLAPRGSCLYSLLSQSAVLQEIYRDDIYTDLPDNDKLTVQLSRSSRFEYLLNYIDTLFQHEKRNIASAIPGLKRYQELLGQEFITVTLLEGVVSNLDTYYKDDKTMYEGLMKKAQKIRDDMLQYSTELGKKYDVYFTISETLKNI